VTESLERLGRLNEKAFSKFCSTTVAVPFSLALFCQQLTSRLALVAVYFEHSVLKLSQLHFFVVFPGDFFEPSQERFSDFFPVHFSGLFLAGVLQATLQASLREALPSEQE
jgi:hypothetical protein